MNNLIVTNDLAQIHAVVGKCNRFDRSVIVVTGCAGFLGFYFMLYLVRYAEDLGIQKVIGLDTFLHGKPKWLNDLSDEYPQILNVYAFNVAKDDISHIPEAADARFIIHGASIASPTFYRVYPVETIDANVWGLRKLLDYYKKSTIMEGLLFFSSSEIYGDPDSQFIPTDEEYRGSVSCHGPRACYDEAKRFGETMCWIFSQQYRMPITVARPFNNYGPGMRLDDKRLPADFATCVLDKRDIIILSDGSPTRTFCYVSDAITGYFLCLLYGKYDYFNIGMDKPELMVRDFAKIYQVVGLELFGYSGKVQYEASTDPDYMTDNPNRRCPALRKARDILGYDPQISVEEGVRRYLSFLNYGINE